ncbi:hypothetical protein VHEMI04226 [[Torrubiella] hemipterigena]|uniref:Uncharacterized protein n=1 Tax=[Torrubiella] hemipterigena TaxID=1531966 RepID=A0A0A1TD83_9HYPO|nr:hypothetical protein VHEMI04226 [[Torrubiella] hemipterigena]
MESVVASLRTQLKDLELRMLAYRQELIAEFHQNLESHLRDAPSPAVADEITAAVQASFGDFPTLSPHLRHQRTGDSISPISPQSHHSPIAHGTDDTQSRPRDRHHELQGLFPPSFLPLLDSHAQELPGQHHPAEPAPPPVTLAHTGRPHTGADDDDPNALIDDCAAGNTLPDQDTMGHRDLPTDNGVDASGEDATSSISSDKSEGKVRKSALRKSSGSAKSQQSPRRVRFDVMGKEVLPTASPKLPTYMNLRPSSPIPGNEAPSCDSILGDDVELSPPPRKISSSDALRALSRTPFEDGAVWTVVNPDSEEASSEHDSSNTTTPGTVTPPQNNYEPRKFYTGTASGNLGLSGDVLDTSADQLSDDDDSSEDEGLSLGGGRKPKPQSPKKQPPAKMEMPIRSAEKSGLTKSGATLYPKTAKTPPKADHARDHEDNDMFDFETEPGMKPIPKATRPVQDEDDDSDSDDMLEVRPSKTTASALSSSLTQSMSIQRSRPKAEEVETDEAAAKFTIGSIGSYKGRPVMMPVVKDPELLARAASLGKVDSIVGSLDQSGLDEGDPSSYRASIASGAFSGTPRSFTERLLMEDMQAERARNRRS